MHSALLTLSFENIYWSNVTYWNLFFEYTQIKNLYCFFCTWVKSFYTQAKFQTFMMNNSGYNFWCTNGHCHENIMI